MLFCASIAFPSCFTFGLTERCEQLIMLISLSSVTVQKQSCTMFVKKDFNFHCTQLTIHFLNTPRTSYIKAFVTAVTVLMKRTNLDRWDQSVRTLVKVT